MQAEQFSSGWRSSEDLQKKQEQLLLTIVDNVVCVAVAFAQAPAAAFPRVAAHVLPCCRSACFVGTCCLPQIGVFVALIRLHVMTLSCSFLCTGCLTST